MKPLLSALIVLVFAGCGGSMIPLQRIASLKTGMTTKEVEKALNTLPPRVAAVRDGGGTREVRQVACGSAEYQMSLYFTNDRLSALAGNFELPSNGYTNYQSARNGIASATRKPARAMTPEELRRRISKMPAAKHEIEWEAIGMIIAMTPVGGPASLLIVGVPSMVHGEMKELCFAQMPMGATEAEIIRAVGEPRGKLRFGANETWTFHHPWTFGMHRGRLEWATKQHDFVWRPPAAPERCGDCPACRAD